MDDIDDDAADRIISQIDTEGDYTDIRKNLVKRFPKWGAYRRDRFAMRIVERVADLQDFKAGRVTRTYTKLALEKAVGIGGTSKARYKVVRDVKGQFLGREGNVKISTRRGSKVWAKNLRTGRVSRIK